VNDGSCNENIRRGDSAGGGLGEAQGDVDGGAGSTRLGRGLRCRNSLSFIPDPFHSLEVRILRTWTRPGIPEM